MVALAVMVVVVVVLVVVVVRKEVEEGVDGVEMAVKVEVEEGVQDKNNLAVQELVQDNLVVPVD